MEFEIKSKEKFSLGIAELWQFRELFYFFTWRDIKVKYKQAILGVAWAILQPTIMMIIFSLIFSRMIGTSAGMAYPLFVICGLVFWNIFSNGVSNAGTSMISNSNIIRKIYFPRIIIPVSSILSACFDFLMSLPLLIAMLIWYRTDVHVSAIYCIPLAFIITFISSAGCGIFLSALTVKYRDFRYIVPFLIQFLFFTTPVIYPVTSGHIWLQKLMMLNPMNGAISLFRSGFSGLQLQWDLIGISALSSLLLFFAGLYYFRKTESYFADLA